MSSIKSKKIVKNRSFSVFFLLFTFRPTLATLSARFTNIYIYLQKDIDNSANGVYIMSMLNRKSFIDALNGRIPALEILILSADSIENVDGKIVLQIRPMQYEYIRAAARGIAARDQYEVCDCLCTHDLDSFVCKDLGNLIERIRVKEF